MKEYLKMNDTFIGKIKHTSGDGKILESGGKFIATCVSYPSSKAILHAINSHDELVAEVERLRSDAERYRFIRNCTTKQSERLVELGHIVGFGVLDAMVDEMIKGA